VANYPDDTVPEVTSVVRTATFLFAAGQETTARLLAGALMYLAEHPECRTNCAPTAEDPAFLEEMLRIGEPGEDRLPTQPAGRPRSAASTSPRARR
jgi:cytochrome P450